MLESPEGALYGRNSIGGAVNIISKQPTDQFEGFARGTLGNGTRRGLSVAASGPISGDELLFRFSGSYRESDGLIENVFLRTEADRYKEVSGRFQLRYEATDALSFDWRVTLSDTDGGAVLYSLFPSEGSANDFSFRPDQNILGFSERELREYSMNVEWVGKELTRSSGDGP